MQKKKNKKNKKKTSLLVFFPFSQVMSKQTYPKRVKGGNLQYKTHCGIYIISTNVFEQSYNIWFHTY
jgi:hypothetical protein